MIVCNQTTGLQGLILLIRSRVSSRRRLARLFLERLMKLTLFARAPHTYFTLENAKSCIIFVNFSIEYLVTR